MIEKRTVFTQIEVTADGHLQIKLDKQIVEGGKVIANEWHRTLIEPGGDVEAQFALVNLQLTRDHGYPAVPAEVAERVKRIAAVEHTPQRVGDFRTKRQKEEVERKARRDAADAENTRTFKSSARTAP